MTPAVNTSRLSLWACTLKQCTRDSVPTCPCRAVLQLGAPTRQRHKLCGGYAEFVETLVEKAEMASPTAFVKYMREPFATFSGTLLLGRCGDSSQRKE